MPPDTTPTRTLTGQCLCGAVHYTVADAFHYAMNCHCSQCRRRATGAAFKPFAGIPPGDHLAVTSGEPDLHTYTEGGPNHDAHGRLRCGSLLYSIVRHGTYGHIRPWAPSPTPPPSAPPPHLRRLQRSPLAHPSPTPSPNTTPSPLPNHTHRNEVGWKSEVHSTIAAIITGKQKARARNQA
jgi:hypothetical protein